MKTLKLVLLALVFIALNSGLVAQKLLPGAYSFSKDKTVYLSLTDGNQLEGKLQAIDKSKGFIKKVEILDSENKEHVFRADQIEQMYIAPVQYDISGKLYEFVYDPGQWDNPQYNQDHFRNGYVCFEQVQVEVGMKTRMMFLQLLNPSFSSKIKVYKDPYMTESVSVKNRLSFIVKDGNRPAFMLGKSTFQDYFVALFGECEQMVPLRLQAKWDQFGQHVYNYTQCK